MNVIYYKITWESVEMCQSCLSIQVPVRSILGGSWALFQHSPYLTYWRPKKANLSLKSKNILHDFFDSLGKEKTKVNTFCAKGNLIWRFLCERLQKKQVQCQNDINKAVRLAGSVLSFPRTAMCWEFWWIFFLFVCLLKKPPSFSDQQKQGMKKLNSFAMLPLY